MKNLESVLINPFTGKELSLDNKKKFGEDHIKRIGTQNTANQFDTMLNDTILVQTNLFGAITSVATNSAIQQSRTQSVDNLITGFTARNSRLNNYLIATGIKGQPLYQEFFPLGVQQFTADVTKGNVEQLMAEMVTAVTNHTTEAGGSATLTEYTNFKSSYVTARGQQLDKISAVSSGRITRQQAEDAWDDQLFHNLLIIADLHRGHPEMLSLFMNQSILRAATSADNDGQGRFTGTVSSGGIAVEGVLVHVVDGNINDETTDAAGGYTTQNLPTGTYTVQYSKAGYVTQNISIEVMDDGDTLHDVNLQTD